MIDAMQWFQLNGKKAMVTGGAAGLCYAMAEGLHLAGAEVVLMDRSPAVGEAAARLGAQGAPVHGVQGDLSHWEGIPALYDRALAALGGRVDILVNGAGIQHPTLGNILYDTGNSADFLKTYTPEMLHNYPITEMITIEEALAKEGLTPGDIDQLILSHLHFDHAGGLQHFVGTKAIDHVLVSEADLKQAWWAVTTGNNGAYIRSLFDVEGIRFETIHDTTWLADDLGLFIQASHTPGVIGLILKTEHHGTILTTSDAIYTADSYRQALPPGGTINATTDEFYDNLERIKAMEKNYNATLLFGHDIDQILDWAGQGVID